MILFSFSLELFSSAELKLYFRSSHFFQLYSFRIQNHNTLSFKVIFFTDLLILERERERQRACTHTGKERKMKRENLQAGSPLSTEHPGGRDAGSDHPELKPRVSHLTN